MLARSTGSENPSESTVTVRFVEDSRSQQQLLDALRLAVSRLKEASVVTEARVTAVYPGATDGRNRALFMVQFRGIGAQVAERLGQLPGVLRAYVASGRRLAAG